MSSPAPAPDDPGEPATKRVRVWRCPACGSTDAGPDEAASVVDLTMMRCCSCGEGGLCDSWERDHDWIAEIELAADAADDDTGWPAHVAPLPAGGRWHELASAATLPSTPHASSAPTAGCARCADADATSAWLAATARREHVLVDESHHSIAIDACDCGQRFAVVFLERIDWSGGEDDQTWLALAIDAAEAAELQRTPADQLRAALHRIGGDRRFLLRMFPTGGARSVQWRDGGFWIGPHD